MNNRRNRVLAVMVLMAAAAFAQVPAGDDWAGLYEQCERAGLQAGSIERILQRCRERHITAAEAGRLLEPARAAAQAGLPTDPVLARVGEGLAKNAPLDTIAEAAQNRLRHLERARLMLQHRRSGADRGETELLGSVALALESGVPEGLLDDVLQRNAQRNASDLKAVVEAGEALTLNGFAEDDARDVMINCLQRNLRRTEILRTVRYAVQRHGEGMESGPLRKALWGSEAAGPRGVAGGGADRGRGTMQRTGASSGFGSAPGVPATGPGSAGVPAGPAVGGPQEVPVPSPGPGGQTPGGGNAPGPGPGGK